MFISTWEHSVLGVLGVLGGQGARGAASYWETSQQRPTANTSVVPLSYIMCCHSYLKPCTLCMLRDRVLQICLMGSRDEFVTSGSDDGRIFIWSRYTGRLVNILTADDQNVTSVVAHPSMPVLASAGSEPTIKLWSPQVPYPPPPPRLLLCTEVLFMIPYGIN